MARGAVSPGTTEARQLLVISPRAWGGFGSHTAPTGLGVGGLRLKLEAGKETPLLQLCSLGLPPSVPVSCVSLCTVSLSGFLAASLCLSLLFPTLQTKGHQSEALGHTLGGPARESHWNQSVSQSVGVTSFFPAMTGLQDVCLLLLPYLRTSVWLR